MIHDRARSFLSDFFSEIWFHLLLLQLVQHWAAISAAAELLFFFISQFVSDRACTAGARQHHHWDIGIAKGGGVGGGVRGVHMHPYG